MKTQSRSLIATATTAFVCVSALAFAGGADRITPESFVPPLRSHEVAARQLCPASACSVVFKTEEGGPPSTVVHVD